MEVFLSWSACWTHILHRIQGLAVSLILIRRHRGIKVSVNWVSEHWLSIGSAWPWDVLATVLRNHFLILIHDHFLQPGSLLHFKELLKLELRLSAVTWLERNPNVTKQALLLITIIELSLFISKQLDSKLWNFRKEVMHFLENFGNSRPVSSLQLGVKGFLNYFSTFSLEELNFESA